MDRGLRAEKLCVFDYLCLKIQKSYSCGAAALAFGSFGIGKEHDIEEIPIQKNEINLGQNNNNINISMSEKIKQQIILYKNLLIHRDEHFCKEKKHISEDIMNLDENIEELRKNIKNQTNATQNYVLNKTKEKEMNYKDITKIIGKIHKNINAGSELELLDSKQNKNEIK